MWQSFSNRVEKVVFVTEEENVCRTFMLITAQQKGSYASKTALDRYMPTFR